eukprot:TRINITY_DN22211_c0_g1_i1.p1 TRINITY_DN22211_c0_g1~~TRINITY_DN22211_c0_g1_i1.p1  ORF type:complete len:281 (-),score=49.92 TRINITY_DN22211_c0_g1_i1:70-912(-)
MEEEKKTNQKKKKKQKVVSVYGNYKSYYGYRIGHNLKEDPRLAVLKKEWFEGKDCFDIGCNEGLITISIAKKFCCRSILGIDIDGGLVETAKWNLRRLAKKERANSKSMNIFESDSERTNGREHRVPPTSLNEDTVSFARNSSPPNEGNLLDRVSFRKENFVESLHACSAKYDTILCLSITKWIHLNWGDNGLITLFVKIWRLLRSGGILVLEPQPWQSYKKKRVVSEITTMNFSNIVFGPELFQEILLDKIGFRSVENITDALQGSSAGFDRPIFVFRK